MVDGGAWGVLGAMVGSAGSALITWLNAHLTQDKTKPVYDKAAMALLRAMLEDGDRWQDVEKLANVIGLNKSDTKEYLIMLGARGDEFDPNLWGLVSRNPFPKVAAPN